MHSKSRGAGSLRPLKIRTVSIKDGARKAAGKPPAKYSGQMAPKAGTPKPVPKPVVRKPATTKRTPKPKKHKFQDPRGYGAAGPR